MGLFTSKYFDPLNLMGGEGKAEASRYEQKTQEEKARVTAAYKKAQEQLGAGSEQAQRTARTGFQTARSNIGTGYQQAKSESKEGYGAAEKTAKEGAASAQARYETPEMVTSRAELYDRVLGKGGMQQDAIDKMKAASGEQYATGMRGAQRATGQFAGDSSARGLAQENVAKAASSLGAERAAGERNIDVQNEQLKRTEQTGAIQSLAAEAYQRAGLDSDSAKYIADLQARAGESLSNLSAKEADALSAIAQNEGLTLSQLQQQLFSGQVALTTEEATALANMTMAGAANEAAMRKNTGMLSGILG